MTKQESHVIRRYVMKCGYVELQGLPCFHDGKCGVGATVGPSEQA